MENRIPGKKEETSVLLRYYEIPESIEKRTQWKELKSKEGEKGKIKGHFQFIY